MDRRFGSSLFVAATALLFVSHAHAIRAQGTTYTFSLLAGGESSYHRDGVGHLARFHRPRGLAVDSADVVYVSDAGSQTIRTVALDGTVSTLAGSAGTSGSSDGTGGAARFLRPAGLVVDGTGVVHVADSGNSTIRRVAQDGTVTTWAGSAGVRGGTDGDRTVATFGQVTGLAFDAFGNLYVTDQAEFSGCGCGHTIRQITPDGQVTTLAGLAGTSGDTDGIGAQARLSDPRGIAVDANGNVFVTSANAIRRVTPAGVVTTFAGVQHESGDADGVGTTARFRSPVELGFDGAGNLLVVESTTGVFGLRQVAPDATVTTIPTLTDTTGALTDLVSVSSILVRTDGSLVFAESRGVIKTLTPDGHAAPLAGSFGWGSDDGPREQAQFFNPHQIALDRRGNLYVADTYNHTIRRIAPTGEVTTAAGLARAPESTSGLAVDARFRNPFGVGVGPDGAIVIADSYNAVVRRLAWGQVSILAGEVGQFGTADGQGAAARFSVSPTPFVGQQVAVDGAGNTYLADTGAHTVRKISAAGLVTTVAGAAGEPGSVDGPGPVARFTSPRGLAVDAAGVVYITDNTTVRRMTLDTVVTTLTTRGGSSLAVDLDGTLLVADGDLRRVSSAGGTLTVTTIGHPDIGKIDGVAVGPAGEVYLAVNNNGGPEVNRIWLGVPSPETARPSRRWRDA